MSVLCIGRREDFRSRRVHVTSVQRTSGHVASPSHPSVLIARAREPLPVYLSPCCRARSSLSPSSSPSPSLPSLPNPNLQAAVSDSPTLALLTLSYVQSLWTLDPAFPPGSGRRPRLSQVIHTAPSLSLSILPRLPSLRRPSLPRSCQWPARCSPHSSGIVSSFTLSSRSLSLCLPRSLLLPLISCLFNPIPSSLPRPRQLLAPLQSPASLSLSLFLPVVLFNPLRPSSRLFHLGCAIEQAASCSSSRQRPPFSSLSLICSLSWAVGLHRPASFRHEQF